MSITPKMVELARQIVADRDAEKCDPGVPALALAEMVIHSAEGICEVGTEEEA